MKTEHGGAKNGGGFWGRREEAKQLSRKARRQQDKETDEIERLATGKRVIPSYLPPDRLAPAPKRYKKDTKRWCKGKVGREHDYGLVEKSDHSGRTIYTYDQCAACGKKTNHKFQWLRRIDGDTEKLS